jgi:hypothetical protein
VGIIAPSQLKVRSHTVEGALCAMGQTFTALGRPDPRLQPSGKLDFRLSWQLPGYSKADPPPHRVKPIPPAGSPTCHSTCLYHPRPHLQCHWAHAHDGLFLPTMTRRICINNQP